MKTFIRLIRRSMLAAAVAALLAAALGVLVLGGLLWRESKRNAPNQYASQQIAQNMVQTESGLALGAQYTPAQWMQGYEWAMVLDDAGQVIWSYDLPENLNHAYTSGEVARFSRWYLQDYPVFCWAQDYGLFVIGLPKGSLWKYAAYASPGMLTDVAGSLLPCLLGLLGLVIVFCLLLSWHGARQLETVAAGLERLSKGQPVQLPTKGFAGELAEKLNQASAHLQRQNERIAQRDQARTQWIAGVSHDVRTPLALILGWAEQLQRDAGLPPAARQKADGICTQSKKLRSLIEDLNLTSKLQYGAQPLRRQALAAGAFMRRLAAEFCESPAGERCRFSLVQSEQAQKARLWADSALLGRLVENLLQNSVQHNPGPVQICMSTEVKEKNLLLTVTDNGRGYPPGVLAQLQDGTAGENEVHILGLHVVEQIAAAHGGKAVFAQNKPKGAKATVILPLGPN